MNFVCCRAVRVYLFTQPITLKVCRSRWAYSRLFCLPKLLFWRAALLIMWVSPNPLRADSPRSRTIALIASYQRRPGFEISPRWSFASWFFEGRRVHVSLEPWRRKWWRANKLCMRFIQCEDPQESWGVYTKFACRVGWTDGQVLVYNFLQCLIL